MTPKTAKQPEAQTTHRPAPNGQTQADKDKSLLDEILSRKAVFRPFQEAVEITLTVGIVLKYFARPTKKGATCPEWQAERFIALCKARQLNPFVGDAFIVGYDVDDGAEFNLITAHQALLKRAEAHPQYDGMESGIIVRRTIGVDENGEADARTFEYAGSYPDPGDVIVGGWARVHRKDRKVPDYVRLRLDAYTGFGPRWKKDPGGMIVKCSEGGALRKAFPNTLSGMQIEEETGPALEAATGRPVPSTVTVARQQAATIFPGKVEAAEPVKKSGVAPATEEQLQKIAELFAAIGEASPAERRARISGWIGREYTGRAQLTEADALTVLDQLNELAQERESMADWSKTGERPEGR